MWQYTMTDELYHHGVMGMKWGKRKASYSTQKAAYKQAKKDLKSTKKANKLGLGIGVNGISKANKAASNIRKAEMNVINAKAQYKAAKSKNSAKAEFNTYRKEMQKSGLAGSIADSNNGGRSTALYNNLKAQKGKAYADKVQKKVQNTAYAQIATSAAIAVGLSFASAYLENN